MAGIAFRGTGAGQDPRFRDLTKVQLRKIGRDAPKEYDTKIDMNKIHKPVIDAWIKQHVTELLGFEDDVLIGLACNSLDTRHPDPRELQLNLTGFLDKDTPGFVLELWKLLIGAQQSPTGLPPQMLDAKKNEILSRQLEASTMVASVSEKLASRKSELMSAADVLSSSDSNNHNLQEHADSGSIALAIENAKKRSQDVRSDRDDHDFRRSRNDRDYRPRRDRTRDTDERQVRSSGDQRRSRHRGPRERHSRSRSPRDESYSRRESDRRRDRDYRRSRHSSSSRDRKHVRGSSQDRGSSPSHRRSTRDDRDRYGRSHKRSSRESYRHRSASRSVSPHRDVQPHNDESKRDRRNSSHSVSPSRKERRHDRRHDRRHGRRHRSPSHSVSPPRKERHHDRRHRSPSHSVSPSRTERRHDQEDHPSNHIESPGRDEDKA